MKSLITRHLIFRTRRHQSGRSIPRFFWRLCLVGSLWLSLTLAGSGADPAPPTPDPKTEQVKAFAKRLIEAPDDEARRHLAASAPSDLRDEAILRRQFNFQVGLVINAGDYPRAEALLAFTRRWCEEHQDRLGVALVDWGLGNSLGYRGDLRASADCFAAARKYFVESGDRLREASVSTNQSILCYRRGDYREALVGLEHALAIHRTLQKSEIVATDLQTIGNIYLHEGQMERAAACWQEGLTEAGNDEDMQANLYSNMATGQAALDDMPGAIAYSEKALALVHKFNDPAVEGVILTNLALYQGESGQLDVAEKLYREALALGRKILDKERQASAMAGLAGILTLRGRKDDGAAAFDYARQAASLARETGDSEQLIEACTVLGRLFRMAGKPLEAQAALGEAIDAVEDARSRLAGGDLEAATFFKDKLSAYREMVALLVETNQPAPALALAERAKARSLIEILHSPKLDPSTMMTAADRTAAQSHAEAIASLNRRLTTGKTANPPLSPAQIGELEAQLAAARRTRDDAEADFFMAHPELRNRRLARDAASGLSNDALKGLLADGSTALLEYVVNDHETFLFTVVREKGAPSDAAPTVKAQRLPIGRAALTAQTNEFRTALADRSMGWRANARKLGTDLLAPVWPACEGADRLVIVPDGPLWELPFQALIVAAERPADPPRTLWEARVVSFAPSLTFLAQMPAAPIVSSPSVNLLAVGNPALASAPVSATAMETGLQTSVLMDNEILPLPDAERQVRALVDLYGPDHSRALLAADARENQFKQLAGNYDVIHFATHGFLNDAAPMYSRLLMSQRDLAPDEDGFLEAWEWLPLKLHARLAVLSACETGRGRIGAGEGMLGFSWALFSAGCPAVVVSQWKVDSASTSELMIAFHRQLRQGAAPATALRTAGLELAKNPKYQHPFYWAPFVLVGAQQTVVSQPQ